MQSRLETINLLLKNNQFQPAREILEDFSFLEQKSFEVTYAWVQYYYSFAEHSGEYQENCETALMKCEDMKTAAQSNEQISFAEWCGKQINTYRNVKSNKMLFHPHSRIFTAPPAPTHDELNPDKPFNTHARKKLYKKLLKNPVPLQPGISSNPDDLIFLKRYLEAQDVKYLRRQSMFKKKSPQRCTLVSPQFKNTF